VRTWIKIGLRTLLDGETKVLAQTNAKYFGAAALLWDRKVASSMHRHHAARGGPSAARWEGTHRQRLHDQAFPTKLCCNPSLAKAANRQNAVAGHSIEIRPTTHEIV
jgi:hypothetical protein